MDMADQEYFECLLCASTLNWYRNLRRHYADVHNLSTDKIDALTIGLKEKKEQCDFCQFWFVKVDPHIEHCSKAPPGAKRRRGKDMEMAQYSNSSSALEVDDELELEYPWLSTKAKAEKVWLADQPSSSDLSNTKQPSSSSISISNELAYPWQCPVCKKELFCSMDLHEEDHLLCPINKQTEQQHHSKT